MSGRSDSSPPDTIDSDMAPGSLGLLLLGRKESYRLPVTMSFLFLDVFSCQFAKEILRDRRFDHLDIWTFQHNQVDPPGRWSSLSADSSTL